jgi:hypothetical protein
MTQKELRAFINALREDEQADLVALVWLGRGDGMIEDWADLRDEAMYIQGSPRRAGRWRARGCGAT